MSELAADQFRNDPSIAQAQALLHDALREHQATLTGIRPADPARRQSYEAMLEQFAELRGGTLYYPYISSGLGRAALVELADGSVRYDMITGIGVHGLGHSDHDLLAAGIDAALDDTVMQGNLQQGAQAMRLARTLLDAANVDGATLDHCFFTTSGAMANENALKMLFQRKAPADRLLAFEHCFAGRTLALAQVTDKPAYRDGLPATLRVDYVPFYDAADAEASTRDAVDALHAHLARHPGRHAGMCMELVQGEGGYYPGSRAFFTALIDVLREHDLPVMVDEVQTFGRTSRLFAYQHFGLDEYVDLVTIGKLSQVCATLFRDAFKPRPGLVSQTFTGSTSALLAGQVIVDRLLAAGQFGEAGRNMRIGARFADRLGAIARAHPDWIAGPFGLGAMVAFTPFDGSAQRVGAFIRALFDAGVIGFIAGGAPMRARFLPPPGCVTDDDIDAVCGIVADTLARCATHPQGS